MNFQIHLFQNIQYNETQKHNNASMCVEKHINTKNRSSTSIWNNANHQPSANQLKLETICHGNLSYTTTITLDTDI